MENFTVGRKEIEKILYEFMGYVISGSDYIIHKALILSGSGRNGKSTFLSVLRALAGESNCSDTSITSIAKDKYAVANLLGKLVNFSEEEPPECFKDTGKFKHLTAGGTVSAEYKYGHPFQIKNKAKMVITYNTMPYIADSSKGMRGRLMIVPCDFDLSATPNKIDAKIGEKLVQELPGIFNKALEGWKRLSKKEHFTPCDDVENAVEETMENSDPVYAFVKNCVEKTKCQDAIIDNSEMYDAYCRFNSREGSGQNVTLRSFSSRIKSLGFDKVQIRRGGARFFGYRGVKLVSIDAPITSRDEF